jgi:hypothetical protein
VNGFVHPKQYALMGYRVERLKACCDEMAALDDGNQNEIL